VLLPEPDGPTMATDSPAWISRRMASSTRTGGAFQTESYDLQTSCNFKKDAMRLILPEIPGRSTGEIYFRFPNSGDCV
jgi:hypothetical protein